MGKCHLSIWNETHLTSSYFFFMFTKLEIDYLTIQTNFYFEENAVFGHVWIKYNQKLKYFMNFVLIQLSIFFFFCLIWSCFYFWIFGLYNSLWPILLFICLMIWQPRNVVQSRWRHELLKKFVWMLDFKNLLLWRMKTKII